jgi:hypothetical protein
MLERQDRSCVSNRGDLQKAGKMIEQFSHEYNDCSDEPSYQRR